MTKSKRFSRIITFALAMLMVVAMAVPTFAYTDWVVIRSADAGYQYLNASGEGQNYDGRPVNVYASTGSWDQKWMPTTSYDGYAKVYNATSYRDQQDAFTLNAYRSGTNWPCTMMKAYSYNWQDANIVEQVQSAGSYLALAQHGKYLGVSGTNVVFKTSASNWLIQ